MALATRQRSIRWTSRRPGLACCMSFASAESSYELRLPHWSALSGRRGAQDRYPRSCMHRNGTVVRVPTLIRRVTTPRRLCARRSRYILTPPIVTNRIMQACDGVERRPCSGFRISAALLSDPNAKASSLTSSFSPQPCGRSRRYLGCLRATRAGRQIVVVGPSIHFGSSHKGPPHIQLVFLEADRYGLTSAGDRGEELADTLLFDWRPDGTMPLRLSSAGEELDGGRSPNGKELSKLMHRGTYSPSPSSSTTNRSWPMAIS